MRCPLEWSRRHPGASRVGLICSRRPGRRHGVAPLALALSVQLGAVDDAAADDQRPPPGAPLPDARDAEIFGPSEKPSSRPAAPTMNGGASSRPAAEPAETQRQAQSAGLPAGTSRDDEILGGPSDGAAGDRRLDHATRTPDLEQRLLALGTDRLQIGGLMLLRFNWSFTDGGHAADHPISMPNLVDVYLDARPTERLRAFVRGRLLWDPSIDVEAAALRQSEIDQARAQGFDPTLASALEGQAGASQTDVQLNELWLKFDIARRLFITVGKQLVRWGASRLWNPTDVVNRSRRPVLSPFDQRNGVPLLKLQLPLESLGWNFYGIGMLDQLNSIDRWGAVGRAEFVVSTMELGFVGAYRQGTDPVVGLDLSAGIWNFDLTGEAALKIDDRFAHDVSLQVSAGLAYNMSVFLDDMLIFGVEVFFNQEGSKTTDPLELFSGQRQFFYAGRHYLALFATLPRPGRWDDWTFTLSSVGNLSDRSFLARFDLSVRLLTYLTLQAFVTGHFGRQGELRTGESLFDPAVLPAARLWFAPGQPDARIPTQVIDVGLWLSLDL